MGKSIKNKGALPWLWLSAVIIVIDQLSKYWATTHLTYQEPQPLVSFLNFNLAYNPGAAFSFLGNAGGWQVYLFLGISLLVSIFLIIWLSRIPRQMVWLATGLSLIIGGALGNFIDRLRLSYVIDFIDFHIKTWHFDTFNIADASITVGAFFLIFSLIYQPKKK